MSSSIGSVEMTIRAVDEASVAIGKVKDNIGGLGTVATTTAGQLDSVNQIDYTKMLTGIAGLTSAGIGIYMAYDRVEHASISLEKAQLRVSNDTDLVAKAQGKYNEAVAKFGADSPEATQAAKDLGQAVEKLKIDTDVVAQRQQDFNASLIFGAATAIPTAITAMSSLKTLMAGLGGATPEAATGLGAVGTGAATVGGAIGVAVLTIRGLWEEFGKLKEMIDGTGGSFGQFNSTMMTISNPFAIMAEGAIGFLEDLGLIPKELPSISDLIGSFYDAEIKATQDCWSAVSAAVTNVLPTITTAIGGFIQWMKDAFQGFYNWLVGGSLWVDMWNAMLSITTEIIGQLLAKLGGGFLDLMKAAFTTVLQAIQTGWNTAWQTIQTAAQTTWDTIRTNAGTWIDGVKTNLSTTLDLIKTAWGTAWDGVKTSAQTVWDTVKTNAGTWIDGVKTTIGTTTDAMKTAWDTAWGNIKTSAQGIWDTMKTNAGTWIEGVKTTISNTQDSLKTMWDTNWGSLKTALDNLMPQIQTNLNTALDGLKSALSTSTGTYGPTMTSALGGMQSAMNAGFLLVKGDWQGALDAISGSLTSWGDAAKGSMDAIMGGLKTAVQTGLDTIKGGWDTFVGALQSGVGTLQRALDSAGGSVQQTLDAVGAATDPATSTVTDAFTGAFNTISTAATNFWNFLTGHSIWPEGMDQIVGSTLAGMDMVVSVLSERLTTMMVRIEEGLMSVASSWYDTFTYLGSVTDGAMSAVVGRMQWAVNEIKRLAQDLQASMVTHSIWPDMLSEMQSQTEAALGNIVANFGGAFGAIPLTVPQAAGSGTAGMGGTAAAAPAYYGPQTITIPITTTVTLDGEVISRQVEQRIVRTVLNRGKKVA